MKNKFILTTIIFILFAISAYGQFTYEAQKLLADDGTSEDVFGEEVNSDGDFLIIGAPYDDDNGSNSGSAYIFYNNAGTWEQHTKLTASDGQENERFGKTVDIHGNWAIVGADQGMHEGEARGSAYIFYYDGSSWTEYTKLTASDGSAYQYFGEAVSIYNDYAVVTAFQYHPSRAYVFFNNSGTWEEIAQLTPTGTTAGSFGFEIDMHEDYIIIGSATDGDNGICSGCAYIYEKPITGWEDMTETYRIIPSDIEEYDFVGCSVSIYGEYAVVGAYGDDDMENTAGAAYIYKRNSGVWEESSKLTVDDAISNAMFGLACNLNDNKLLIGAVNDGEFMTGSAYVFQLIEDTWTQTAKLIASDAIGGDKLGSAVTILDEFYIATERGDMTNGYNAGAVMVYTPSLVNIGNMESANISIYPNPTNGIVNFQFKNDNIQNISISDITGKQIIEKTSIKQNETIDLSNFANGIYIIKIQRDNEIFTTKIIKE